MKTLIFAFLDDTQDLSNLTEYAPVLLTNLLFRVDPFVFSRKERSTGSLISPFFTRFTGFSFRLLIPLAERKKRRKLPLMYIHALTQTRAREMNRFRCPCSSVSVKVVVLAAVRVCVSLVIELDAARGVLRPKATIAATLLLFSSLPSKENSNDAQIDSRVGRRPGENKIEYQTRSRNCQQVCSTAWRNMITLVVSLR